MMKMRKSQPLPVRTMNDEGEFGGMVLRVSANDKIAIFGNSAFAIQVQHPDGRCVRVGWDGDVTVGDRLVETGTSVLA